jgi:hypothetical protein
MPTKKKKKSKIKRKRSPVAADAERETNQSGPWEDVYQTNIAKGNLGTLEGETSGLVHDLTRGRSRRAS